MDTGSWWAQRPLSQEWLSARQWRVVPETDCFPNTDWDKIQPLTAVNDWRSSPLRDYITTINDVTLYLHPDDSVDAQAGVINFQVGGIIIEKEPEITNIDDVL